MYSSEQLFVLRIDELKQILANPTAPNLLDSSLRLRQILLDNNCLLHQVNRKRGMKIWFIVTDLTARPNPDHPAAKGAIYSQIAGGIAPQPWMIGVPQKRIKLDDFLRLEVLYFHGHVSTVRDLISYVANFAGGVHKSQPNTEGTKLLEQAAETIQLGGLPSVLAGLQGIIEVVLVACEELYEAMRA